MHLSTSSFSRHVPGGPWLRIWIAGLIIAILALGGLETFWRERGHIPSVVDDPELWSYHRHRVDMNGAHTIVLTGASRIQLDISVSVLKDIVPCYEIVQLAIDGKHPMASLIDLAQDNGFKGIVICSMTGLGFQREYRDHQQDYVQNYHKYSTPNTRLNRPITSIIQEHFVVVDPYLKLRRIALTYWKSKRLPLPRFLITRHDRSRQADYTRINVNKQRQFRVKRIQEIYAKSPPLDPEEWLQHAVEIEPFVKKILDRGGKVVFVRLPSSGKHWEIDEKFLPKREYWDQFAALTSAETIHFQDINSLRKFHCPEGSHLDYRDAPHFTRALIEELIRRKIIEPPH